MVKLSRVSEGGLIALKRKKFLLKPREHHEKVGQTIFIAISPKFYRKFSTWLRQNRHKISADDGNAATFSGNKANFFRKQSQFFPQAIKVAYRNKVNYQDHSLSPTRD